MAVNTMGFADIQSRIKPVAGIILAAGCGSRMGRAKQLLPFEQTTLLGRVIDTAKAAMLDALILVLGFEADRIRPWLETTYPDLTGIRVVENPDWQNGQSFSVAAGLAALTPDTGGALFLLADLPLVTVRTINNLVSAFQTTDQWIVVPRFQGKRGNPVLVAAPLFERLKQPAGDAGARVLFDEFKLRLRYLDVDDPGILMDVDTPEDYAA
ncbi:MAG TPA: nucleotidyltransferase family protein, partial [Desulfotignum sp.]|nr:nucleotidyltransferase family protein [Desulfotignum sp.]